MAIRRRIQNNANLKNHSIHFQLNNQEALSDQVSKTPFNEMPKSKLEHFLSSLDLSLPRGGWHIVRVTHGWIRQMVEGSSVAQDHLEFFGEPPKEDARPSVPMPIRHSTSTKKTVLNCSQVPGLRSFDRHELPTIKLQTSEVRLMREPLPLSPEGRTKQSNLPRQSPSEQQ